MAWVSESTPTCAVRPAGRSPSAAVDSATRGSRCVSSSIIFTSRAASVITAARGPRCRSRRWWDRHERQPAGAGSGRSRRSRRSSPRRRPSRRPPCRVSSDEPPPTATTPSASCSRSAARPPSTSSVVGSRAISEKTATAMPAASRRSATPPAIPCSTITPSVITRARRSPAPCASSPARSLTPPPISRSGGRCSSTIPAQGGAVCQTALAAAARIGGGVTRAATTTIAKASPCSTMPSVSAGIGSPKTTMPPMMHETFAAVDVDAMTGTASPVLHAARRRVEGDDRGERPRRRATARAGWRPGRRGR